MWCQEEYFDITEFVETPLQLNFLNQEKHRIDITKSDVEFQVHTAPAVSIETGLELLNPSDIQINMATFNQ